MIFNKLLLPGLFVVLLSFMATAQTQEGGVLIGGESNLNFSFVSSKWQSDSNYGEIGKTTTIAFSPQAGYFVMDGLAIGVEIPIAYSSTKNEDDSTNKTSSYALSPLVRYYFGDKGEKIKPYMHLSGGLGNEKRVETATDELTTTTSGNIFLLQVGCGAAYFVSKNLSFDLGVRLVSTRFKPKENNKDNYKEIESGFVMKLGVVVFL